MRFVPIWISKVRLKWSTLNQTWNKAEKLLLFIAWTNLLLAGTGSKNSKQFKNNFKLCNQKTFFKMIPVTPNNYKTENSTLKDIKKVNLA